MAFTGIALVDCVFACPAVVQSRIVSAVCICGSRRTRYAHMVYDVLVWIADDCVAARSARPTSTVNASASEPVDSIFAAAVVLARCISALVDVRLAGGTLIAGITRAGE